MNTADLPEIENHCGIANRPTCTRGSSTSARRVQPSCIDDNQRDAGAAPAPSKTTVVSKRMQSHSLLFKTGIPLQKQELLLYCLLRLEFPQRTFTSRSVEKYTNISKAIQHVFGIAYSNESINNYFYRARKNIVKDLGKVKGYLRWCYYKNHIEIMVEECETVLKKLLTCPTSIKPTEIVKLTETRDRQCQSENSNGQTELHEQGTETNSVQRLLQPPVEFCFEDLESQRLKYKEHWHVSYNKQEATTHVFYFGGNKGYAQMEITVCADGSWNLILEGNKKPDLDLS